MKDLIIYFSHTGENWVNGTLKNIDKGNTEIIAEKLKEYTNADIFRVEEINPYPNGYYECCDVAKEELSKDFRPKLKESIKSISSYNTIYICSPIWWGHLPMPLFTVLENLDFAGKIIKYIVTHEGSGFGEIPSDIKKICKNADIKEGLAIKGSLVNDADDMLKEYINR